MNIYDLYLKILLYSLPFRCFDFIKKDLYFEYLDNRISFKEFVKCIFNILRHEIDITNLDEFALLVRHVYPKNISYKDKYIIYYQILNELGRSLLRLDGNVININDIYGMDTDIFSPYFKKRKLLVWYYLSRYMDMGIININHLIQFNQNINDYLKENPNLNQINVINRLHEKILEKGIYENHVHFGGSIGFEYQWWFLICKYGFNNSKKERIRSFNSNSISNVYIYVLTCIIVRYYITKYLVNKYAMKNEKIVSFYRDYKILLILDKFANGNLGSQDEKIVLELIEKIDEEVYQKLEITDYSENKSYDRIDCFIGKISSKKSEYYFEYLCLSYINSIQNYPSKEAIAKIFLNYIRIKNCIFSMKVENNLTKGLKHFIDVYKNNNIKEMDLGDKLNIVLDHYLYQKYVKGIELKTVFLSNRNILSNKIDLKNNLKLLLECYFQWIQKKIENNEVKEIDEAMKLAFVYLGKKMDETISNICLDDFFKGGEYKSLNYGNLQYSLIMNLIILQKMRTTIPNLKYYIVGIDIAGDENLTEPYVFAPIYRLIRNSRSILNKKIKNENLKEIYKRYGVFPGERLGLTYHVGEVFSSIISGLRHIDEVIENFDYTDGDRLGHATALSTDMKEYLHSKKVCMIKKGEYLKNLLWIYILKSKKVINDLELLELRDKIYKISKSIFGDQNTIQIHNLIEWYKRQFDLVDSQISIIQENKCLLLPCPLITKQEKKINNWSVEQLINASHCKIYISKMNEMISITEDLDDYKLYYSIQKYIRNKISSKGIIVEINPVSNLTIGPLENASKLPYLNVDSYALNEDHEKHLILTINTDDPAIFNTNLMFQFALLEYQLIDKQIPQSDIQKWIDNLRKNSIKSTFIDSRKQTYKEILKELKKLIEDIDKFVL